MVFMAINKVDMDSLLLGIIPDMSQDLSTIGPGNKRNPSFGSPYTMNQVITI
jgi:hypothetical protein